MPNLQFVRLARREGELASSSQIRQSAVTRIMQLFLLVTSACLASIIALGRAIAADSSPAEQPASPNLTIAQELQTSGTISAADDRSDPSAACETKLTSFVMELDVSLDSKPRSIDPLLNLLQKYFPLEHCNIDVAIRITRQSKYAMPITQSSREHVFAFNSRSENYNGYIVSFGLVKISGNSEYPSVTSQK